MTSFRRVSLVIGVLVAALVASTTAAGTTPWLVVARSHKWPTVSGSPAIVIRMPVGVVNGKRQPEALAARLLVRQNGRYRKGKLFYEVRCGGWRQFRQGIEVMTPAIRALPFRTWRARSCSITLGAMSARSNDDIRLQLLCRARSRSACIPLE